MYIDIVPNRSSAPAVLLRESIREGGRIRKHTLANLSALPMDQVKAIRDVLKGHKMVAVEDAFEIIASRHHGHVAAVELAMKQLGFAKLLSARPCSERQLVLAMIAARIVDPQSKLATVNSWAGTTIPEIFDVQGVRENELYEAMDWLLERQDKIESQLAKRHLEQGGLALYDLSSSYFEGTSCALAALGHNRDGKKGKLQVNFGLLTDARGCPVSVSVFKGNVGDTTTLATQIDKLRSNFRLQRFVVVGDRGMITQKQVDELRDVEGAEWITALRPGAIQKLIDGGYVQMGLFDERGLFEVEQHPDFPGERLVACRNPELAKLRAAKRQSLMDATRTELQKVCAMVERGRLSGGDKIGLRVGKVINKYKVAKHFRLDIQDKALSFSVDQDKVNAESALDGIYIVRTSLAVHDLDADDTVRSYKLLANVERAFRSLKTMDLNVRPIHHYVEGRVRGHILLCALAYYVKWHMLEAWRPLLFCDEDQAAKKSRDPVKPATRSAAAQDKAASKLIDDGSYAHSFQTLLRSLATIVRNTCRSPKGSNHFDIDTLPNSAQRRAVELLGTINT
jgi:transposase